MGRKVQKAFCVLWTPVCCQAGSRVSRSKLSLAKQRRSVAYLDDLQGQVDELTALQEATQAELDALLPKEPHVRQADIDFIAEERTYDAPKGIGSVVH